MDYESRLALSFYQEIAVINEEHKIYLVRHIKTNRFYVKKILDIYNRDVYARLWTAHIKGIPQIELVYAENNTLTIIEEYISGKTLDELICEKHAFTDDEIASYISSLCDILERIHSLKPALIHRDIKPSNVMISNDGSVYLIDFNAARHESQKEEDTMLLGTKGYAAPEQYGFGSSDEKTDIYAVGVLLNTLLNGEYSHNISSNPRFANIIKRCTSLDPKMRYSSITQVKSAIPSSFDGIGNLYRRIKYLPPGFRSGSIPNMLASSLYYALAIYMSIGFEMKVYTGLLLVYARMFVFILLIIPVIVICNYLDIQKLMPLCRKPSRFLRFLGGVLELLILLTVHTSALLIINALFS